MIQEALDIIREWGEENRILLINKYTELGLKASGRWAESLEDSVETSSKGATAKMEGEDYTKYIAYGRGPNADQSPEALKSWVGYAGATFLKDWVQDKGLDISPYAVAYKIAREGWSVPNPHNAGGLLDDVVNNKRIDILMNRLGKLYQSKVSETLIKSLEK